MPIYVSGHRNPDTDSISAAVSLAELRQRLDEDNTYVPVRLGEVNAQTAWVLEQAGAEAPEYLPHIKIRIRDVMRPIQPVANHDDPVRKIGLIMARQDLDLVPVIDDDGKLCGVVTERALARRYIRESREASSLDQPTAIGKIVELVQGELVNGDPERLVEGRVWALAMDPSTFRSKVGEGDIVVVGNRADSHRAALDLGVALLVTSNGLAPDDEIRALAEERGVAVVVSALDTYVASRMVTLAAPCRAVMDTAPLTVNPEDLVAEHEADIKDIHYRAAIAVDGNNRPVGLVSRSDLLSPRPRRVILVDHAESGQSVPGIEQAEIVEILDHHHIGSIETKVPVRACFDPVGCTCTLIIEAFREAGIEPSRPVAMLCLSAIMSDTVILTSPTTTDRDRRVVEWLEGFLGLNAAEYGRDMFETTSDVSAVAAKDIVTRDAKEYEAGSGQLISIAQIETVGRALLERQDELLEALSVARKAQGHALAALMVTDIHRQSTSLLVSGDAAAVARAFDKPANGPVLELPGVMSRKKQVAPQLLGAL